MPMKIHTSCPGASGLTVPATMQVARPAVATARDRTQSTRAVIGWRRQSLRIRTPWQPVRRPGKRTA